MSTKSTIFLTKDDKIERTTEDTVDMLNRDNTALNERLLKLERKIKYFEEFIYESTEFKMFQMKKENEREEELRGQNWDGADGK